METKQATAGEVRVEHVGGIDEATLRFEPGVTVLAGRNATNRTSMLRAIMAAIGSDHGSLKADADAGAVELEYGGKTYTRTFERQNGTVVTGGDPYLEDRSDIEVADLFAFLLESNEARRAVVTGADLREIIMRPVDTEAIRAEIDQAMRDRNRIDEELAELDELAERLPALEERRQTLFSEIEELEPELSEKRTELEEAEASAGDEATDDGAMAELSSARNESNRTRQRLETERESVESLEAELKELREELKELPDPDEVNSVEERLEHLRERQSRLDDAVSELQSLVEFNQKLLDGAGDPVRDLLMAGDAETTDALLPESEQDVVCWTCGSTVEQGDIEEAVERLRTVREDALAERGEVRAEIDELTGKQRERRERREECEQLKRRIERAESELEERRERIEELEADRADLEERIEELEAEVAAEESDAEVEVQALNREIIELEFELERTKDEHAEVTEEIEEIEARLDERETLEDDREATTERLQELRERIDRIEAEAVEAFNEHMAEVLVILDYENLERIWLDRLADADSSEFELKIVRSTPDGAVYEDTIDHLSESEREVTGLVFALAGYLVHDTHETVPMMVLDSIESIDSERIASLLEYLSEYAETIMVALLPADAEAVSDDYDYVRDI